MTNLYARSVFFTADAERSLRFYKEQLGFAEDWRYDEDGRAFVFQVSLLGLELIVNQTDEKTRDRAGRGRVFIGLDDEQAEPLREHILSRGIRIERVEWGRKTLVVRDVDANEVFFWLPDEAWARLPA